MVLKDKGSGSFPTGDSICKSLGGRLPYLTAASQVEMFKKKFPGQVWSGLRTDNQLVWAYLAALDLDLAAFDLDLALIDLDLALIDLDLALIDLYLALIDLNLVAFDLDLASFDL